MFVIQQDDAGRSKSKRSKQKQDCAVRALAKVAEISYDEAYDLLAKYADRKSGHGVKSKQFRSFIENNTVNGFVFKWVGFKSEKGKARINCRTFALLKESKRAIVKNQKHVYASINGVVYEDSGEFNASKCVYGCWAAERI